MLVISKGLTLEVLSLPGASVKVFMCCNEGHNEEWSSSPDIKAGRGSIPLINLMIVCYTLFSGLHWNQFKVVSQTVLVYIY